MSEIKRNLDSDERNSDEETSARTRPFGFEEIMLRRKLKLENESAKLNNDSPTEPFKMDDLTKEPSKMDESPKEPSKMDDSPKHPSKMDDSPKEPSKTDDLQNEPSRSNEFNEEKEFEEPKKEGWRLASMVVTSNLESETEKEKELDKKVKERDKERERERERKRSDDHETKRRKKEIGEPISNKRDSRKENDSSRSERKEKSREKSRERDRDRSKRRRSSSRDKSRERERDRSKRRRSSSREKLERERRGNSREKLGGYSPRKRQTRDSSLEKKKSDQRERKFEKRKEKSDKSPERKYEKINDNSHRLPERKSDKRNDKSQRSPEIKSEKRNNKSDKSPERKSGKRDDKSDRSPERKSGKRNDKSEKSPERKSGRRNDKSEKSPERRSGKRNDRSERSPKSEKRNDRYERSPERKSGKRDDKSERSSKSEKRNDRSERFPKSEKQNDKSESKIPVPVSVEKKSEWDQLPAGSLVPVSVGSILGAFKMPVMKNVIQFQTGTKKTVPVEPVQLTQATRPQRRLHIDNISENISEKMLIDGINGFFNGTSNPCLTCDINKEKRQAIVEFLTPEDATKALSFHGKNLLGTDLKIRRPKDYVEVPIVALEKPVEEEKVISNVVKDSPHKVFIGGISKALSSEMLMEIVSVFGALNAYHFTYNEELGAPCAFLEYMDHSVTLKACAGLNGMKLAGSVLTVLPALPDLDYEEIEKPPFYDVPAHAKSLLMDPTEVLHLTNLFDRDEFLKLPKNEVDEILEDIRLECTRFGTVKSIKMIPPTPASNTSEEIIITKSPEKQENSDPVQNSTELDLPINSPNGEDKENTPTGEDVLEAGTVLVEFVRKEATQMAAHVLHGRLFADRVVSTRYVPLELYLQKFPK